jgi:tetratricopeptide (TPR) repeat protein
MKIKALFVLLLAAVLSAIPTIYLKAQEAEFRAGNEAYQNKEYDEASQTYEIIRKNGLISVALYYNLGNAYYQQGKLGPAILNYERALKLAPNDKQVANNLDVARQDLKDIQVGIEKSNVIASWMSLQHLQSSKGWSWLGIVFIWFGVAGIVLWLLGPSRRLKKVGFLSGIALLIFSLLPFLLAYGRAQEEYHSMEAIIMVEETMLKAAPENESKAIQTLHEGSKVKVIDAIGEWHKVQLNDTTEGWLLMSDTEFI